MHPLQRDATGISDEFPKQEGVVQATIIRQAVQAMAAG